MNLLCAEGLRGAEKLNLSEALVRLDGLAKHVEQETTRHLYRFRDRPADFNRSEAYFRMLTMATVLQQDLNVHYNSDRATEPGVFEPNDIFFANAEDVFIHGLIGDQRSGTCSSMPVFYAAVGRRLGYPLKLVTAKNHLFIRWDGGGERFNIDATGVGFNTFDDDYYRRWPLPTTDEEIRVFGYLKSLTAAEELAVFLSIRGQCLMAMGRAAEAVASHESAIRYAPESRMYRIIAAYAREEMAARVRPQLVIPPDPLLQTMALTGDPNHELEAEVAAWNAQMRSRQRRGFNGGPPDPQPGVVYPQPNQPSR
ncbi:MAG: hypothetical protein HY043_07785 [Verrucomicrobia bacterium]|nr:hypothetical protein [Verrucomicrobiota bacterium]